MTHCVLHFGDYIQGFDSWDEVANLLVDAEGSPVALSDQRLLVADVVIDDLLGDPARQGMPSCPHGVTAPRDGRLDW